MFKSKIYYNNTFIIIIIFIMNINTNAGNSNTIDIGYDQIADYRIEDNEHIRPNDSGMYVCMYACMYVCIIYSTNG